MSNNWTTLNNRL